MRKLGVALLFWFIASSAFAGDGNILRAQGKPIPGRYIVQIAPGHEVRATVSELALGQAARVLHRYEHALRGAAFEMDEHQAQAMARHPKVVLVEEDVEIWPVGTQANPPSWGLDRVDQRNLPLDASYTWDFNGTGVNVYVIDGGIRFTHTEFGGRAFPGIDIIGDGQNGNDCHGHGTHVAGTIGGATFGVAKNVRLFSVRVFGCAGGSPSSVIVAGIDWVTANRVLPAVANASLSGGISVSLDTAVDNAVASGIFFAVAAGNISQGHSSDACFNSPARAAGAYTVASSNQVDARNSGSSFGSCVEMFAPGTSITSAWHTGDTATNTISGTSMATPHVAGAAAILLEANPSLTPAQVANALNNRATVGILANIGAGSPNRLLYTRPIPKDAQVLSQSVPANMVTGQSYPVSVTLRNAGSLAWSPVGPQCNAYRLATVTSTNWGPARVDLPSALAPGQTVTLNFTITAPTTPGTYPFQWRMVHECVEWFGDLTPNVAVNVQTRPPTASFTYACTGLACTFDASASSADLGIASYSWTFGDSSVGAGKTPTHTYSISGQYTVTLTVTDTAGTSASTDQNILLVFADVPLNYWARAFIETLYYRGVTKGCLLNPLRYCPDSQLTRAEVAPFLLRSKLGGDYEPPPATCTPLRFADVPCSHWAAAWIEELASRGITVGCGSGNYCPEELVDRSQAAVFLLRTLMGPDYLPPAVDCNAPHFSDVPCTHWAAAWIEELARQGITAGCGPSTYCPADIVSRGMMAVFLVNTFNFSTAEKYAQVLSQGVPSTMAAGQNYSASMTLKNVGSRTWELVGPQCNAYRLGTVTSTNWGPGRAELPAILPPGQQVTLNFTVTAPSTPGTYPFQWRMVHECVEWFGDLSPNVNVDVVP